MNTKKENDNYYIVLDFSEYQGIKCLLFLYSMDKEFGLIEYQIKDTIFFNFMVDNIGREDEYIIEIDRPTHIYKLINLMIQKYSGSIFNKYLEQLKTELEQNSLRRSILLKKLKQNIKNGRSLEENR